MSNIYISLRTKALASRRNLGPILQIEERHEMLARYYAERTEKWA